MQEVFPLKDLLVCLVMEFVLPYAEFLFFDFMW
jgi:hypothetical protein